MRVTEISKNVYQFSTYYEPVNFTFNQYLVSGDRPMLVQTGAVSITRELVPELRKLLQGAELSCVFISHFESDECGGLGLLLQHFPGARPVCSQTTARQLAGFGICDSSLPQAPAGTLETSDASYTFIGYDSEMHLWQGLVLFEKKRGVLFSSDLFMQFGKPGPDPITSSWRSQLDSLGKDSTLGPERAMNLRRSLESLPVGMIAPGHGACIRVS